MQGGQKDAQNREAEETGEIVLNNFFNFTPEDIQVVFSPFFTNIAERDVSGLWVRRGNEPVD